MAVSTEKDPLNSLEPTKLFKVCMDELRTCTQTIELASAELTEKAIGTPAVAIEVLIERLTDPAFTVVLLISRVEANDALTCQHRIKRAAQIPKRSCNAMQPILAGLDSLSTAVGIGQFEHITHHFQNSCPGHRERADESSRKECEGRMLVPEEEKRESPLKKSSKNFKKARILDFGFSDF
jgi:hypothetical protein